MPYYSGLLSTSSCKETAESAEIYLRYLHDVLHRYEESRKDAVIVHDTIDMAARLASQPRVRWARNVCDEIVWQPDKFVFDPSVVLDLCRKSGFTSGIVAACAFNEQLYEAQPVLDLALESEGSLEIVWRLAHTRLLSSKEWLYLSDKALSSPHAGTTARSIAQLIFESVGSQASVPLLLKSRRLCDLLTPGDVRLLYHRTVSTGLSSDRSGPGPEPAPMSSILENMHCWRAKESQHWQASVRYSSECRICWENVHRLDHEQVCIFRCGCMYHRSCIYDLSSCVACRQYILRHEEFLKRLNSCDWNEHGEFTASSLSQFLIDTAK